MGFRSKLMSEDFSGIQVPDWFIEKHPKLHYGWDTWKPILSISSRSERKFYSKFKEEDIFVDIQKVLQENEFTGFMSVVLLHECGGVTLVKISKDKIIGQEPIEWKEVEEVEHNYCYGCSEPKSTINNNL